MKFQALLMGASLGGVTAVQKLLKNLPIEELPPVLIIQHISTSSRVDIELVYGTFFKGKVEDVVDKTPLRPGHVYFAPAGYHMLIEKDGTLSLTQDDPVHYSRPSIDVTFDSAAKAFNGQVCAILLTGSNSDGAMGLKKIHDAGGYTIVQNPREAEAPQMPAAAIALHEPNFVGKLAEISTHLSQVIGIEHAT